MVLTDSSDRTVFTVPLTPMSALPTAAFIDMGNQTLSIANGTRLDCSLLIAGEELMDLATNARISSCAQVAAGYGVTKDDLKLWNPSLATASPCILQPKLQYCVQRILIDPPQNVTSYCLAYDIAPVGYTCSNFTVTRGVHPARFVEWNPSVGANCVNW